MERMIDVLGRCNKYLCAFFLASMVLIVFVNTVMRYAFNSGIIQAEELVRYLFLWGIYLAVISVYYEGKHICVTTVTDKLSPHTLLVFTLITNFGVLYALAILFEGSVMYFAETTNMGQVTNIPYKCAVAPVLLASVSCICIVVMDSIKKTRALLRGDR